MPPRTSTRPRSPPWGSRASPSSRPEQGGPRGLFPQIVPAAGTPARSGCKPRALSRGPPTGVDSRAAMRVGQQIGGRFPRAREVAAGGVGRIFQARDEHAGGMVALKVVSAPGGEAPERFVRDPTVLARL